MNIHDPSQELTTKKMAECSFMLIQATDGDKPKLSQQFSHNKTIPQMFQCW